MKPQAVLVGVLLAGAAGIAAFLLLVPQSSSGHVLSGYVEGEPLYPAAPLPGRLTNIAVKRGDVVQAGQVLFSVDPAQGEANVGQAQADLAAAKALAADARKGQRPAELGVYEAEVAAARAQLTETQQAYDRAKPLVDAGALPRAQLDAAVAARDTASGQLNAAQKRLQAAMLGSRTDQIAAADERVRQAQAAAAGAEAQLADQSQVAPSAGRIEEVFFQQGEWTPANQPVLSLIPEDRVRIRFFAPEVQVVNYAIGREVAFTCDGCPAGLKATISYVAPRPEFTPPVIYSRESRERMVFLIEASPAAGVKLTPGQPIDVAPLGPAAG